MALIDTFLESWADPHARHAMLVQFPVVLGVLGVIPMLVLAGRGFRNRTMVLVMVLWFGAAAATAWLAEQASDASAALVEGSQPPLTDLELEALAWHTALADAGWIWPLVPAALLLLTLVQRKDVRIAAGSLATAASVGVAIWVLLTVQAGHALVYEHGLSVPARDVPVPDPALPGE